MIHMKKETTKTDDKTSGDVRDELCIVVGSLTDETFTPVLQEFGERRVSVTQQFDLVVVRPDDNAHKRYVDV